MYLKYKHILKKLTCPYISIRFFKTFVIRCTAFNKELNLCLKSHLMLFFSGIVAGMRSYVLCDTIGVKVHNLQQITQKFSSHRFGL